MTKRHLTRRVTSLFALLAPVCVLSTLGVLMPRSAALAADPLPSGVTMWLKLLDDEIAKTRAAMGLAPAAEDLEAVWVRNLQPFIYPLPASADDNQARGQASSALEWVKTILDEKIPREYSNGTPPDHPDLQAARQHVTAFEAEVNTFLAKPKADQNAFIDKVIIDSPTDDIAKLKLQAQYVAEATALLEQYKQVVFPGGKPLALGTIEGSLTPRLRDFPSNYDASLAQVVAGVNQRLDNQQASLDMNKDWRTDPSKTPVPQNEGALQELSAAVAAAATLLPADDARLAALNAKLAAILKENEERKVALLERTLLGPDRFKGKEAAAIKTAAKAAVTKKHPGATILRGTIPDAAWRTEAVIESTDTTNTALQYRFTRWVSVHIAARTDGQLCKYTVYVGIDKVNGSAGALQGHVMFTDKMLEKNLNKTAAK
jgi:hypothetical protein